MISVMKGRSHSKLTLFTVSKDEWDTKKDVEKYMKNP